MALYIPFIHRVIKKKEKQLEQLPLFIELPPVILPKKVDETNEVPGVIIIDLM